MAKQKIISGAELVREIEKIVNGSSGKGLKITIKIDPVTGSREVISKFGVAKLTKDIETRLNRVLREAKHIATIPIGNEAYKFSGTFNSKELDLMLHGMKFDQWCGYLFEVIFYEECLRRAVLLGNKVDAQGNAAYQSKKSTVSAYRYDPTGEIKNALRTLSNQVIDQILAENAAHGNNVLIPKFTKVDSANDIILYGGGTPIRLDLKSYVANKNNIVDWVSYGTRFDTSLGLTPFLNYLHYQDKEHWGINSDGSRAPNWKPAPEWVDSIVSQEHILKKYLMYNSGKRGGDIGVLKLLAAKGEGISSLKQKRLVINGRTSRTGEGWTVHLTLDMDTLIERFSKFSSQKGLSFKYSKDKKFNPPYGSPYWGLFGVEQNNIFNPYVGVQVNAESLESRGSENLNQSGRLKGSSLYSVDIGFAINHNFYSLNKYN